MPTTIDVSLQPIVNLDEVGYMIVTTGGQDIRRLPIMQIKASLDTMKTDLGDRPSSLSGSLWGNMITARSQANTAVSQINTAVTGVIGTRPSAFQGTIWQALDGHRSALDIMGHRPNGENQTLWTKLINLNNAFDAVKNMIGIKPAIAGSDTAWDVIMDNKSKIDDFIANDTLGTRPAGIEQTAWGTIQSILNSVDGLSDAVGTNGNISSSIEALQLQQQNLTTTQQSIASILGLRPAGWNNTVWEAIKTNKDNITAGHVGTRPSNVNNTVWDLLTQLSQTQSTSTLGARPSQYDANDSAWSVLAAVDAGHTNLQQVVTALQSTVSGNYSTITASLGAPSSNSPLNGTAWYNIELLNTKVTQNQQSIAGTLGTPTDNSAVIWPTIEANAQAIEALNLKVGERPQSLSGSVWSNIDSMYNTIEVVGNRPTGVTLTVWEKIASLDTSVSDSATAVSTLTSSVGTQPQTLTGTIWDNISANSVAIDNASNAASDAMSAAQTADNKATANQQAVAIASSVANNALATANDANTLASTANNKATANQNSLNQLSALITDNTNDISAINADKGSKSQGTTGTIWSNIETLATSVDSLNSGQGDGHLGVRPQGISDTAWEQIVALNTAMGNLTLGTRPNTLNGTAWENIEANHDDIESLQTEVGAKPAGLPATATVWSEIDAASTAASGDISALQQDITNLENNVGTRPAGMNGTLWDNIAAPATATVIFDQSPAW